MICFVMKMKYLVILSQNLMKVSLTQCSLVLLLSGISIKYETF